MPGRRINRVHFKSRLATIRPARRPGSGEEGVPATRPFASHREFGGDRVLRRPQGRAVAPPIRVPSRRRAHGEDVQREAVVYNARAIPDEVLLVGRGNGRRVAADTARQREK